MAKKKRGRPPGSTNKKSIGKSVATMDVSQLRAHIDSLQSVLAKKIHEQRAYFEDQLSQLGGYVSKRDSAAVKAVTPGKRAKAKPKYQSKKNNKPKVVRARRDPGLDARGDEGHKAQEGRFRDQVADRAANAAPYRIAAQDP